MRTESHFDLKRRAAQVTSSFFSAAGHKTGWTLKRSQGRQSELFEKAGKKMRVQQHIRGKQAGGATSAGQPGLDPTTGVHASVLGELPSTHVRDLETPLRGPIEKIAHDFNNVLTLVLGYAENLLRTLPENHPGRPLAEEVCKAAREGERLSLSLSALAQPGPASSMRSEQQQKSALDQTRQTS
jgi:hypothetical protein